MRIEQITKDYDIKHRWRMFPLHPETPQEGLLLEELFKGSTVNVTKMLEQLNNTAQQLGLPFGTRTMTYNSRLAQELGLWAESIDPIKAELFHKELFKAYFKNGHNIALLDHLLPIVSKCQLPVDTAQKIVSERIFSDAVDHDWASARNHGVTAVPTLTINNRSLAGFQPYDHIQFFLLQAGITPTRPS